MIAPPWARIGGPVTHVFQGPVERALARHARRANLDSRRRAERSGGRSGPGSSRRRPSARSRRSPPRAWCGPIRPDRLVASADAPSGASAPARAARSLRPRQLHGDRPGADRRARHDHASRSSTRAPPALAGALHQHFDLGAGTARRDHVPQPSRLRPGGRRGFAARLRPRAAEHRLRRSPARRRARARGRDRGRLRRGVRAACSTPPSFEGTRVIGLARGRAEPPDARCADLGRDRRRARRRARQGRTIMLTSGTTGTPKGAIRTVSPRALMPLALLGLPRAGAVQADAARRRPAGRLPAPVPPLRPDRAVRGSAARLADRDPPAFRPRGDARADRAHRAGVLLAVPTMLKRIMDLPERDPRALRHLVAADDRLRRRAAAARARDRGHGRVRRHPLQRLRLDRGRVRARSRPPRTCARPPGTVGQARCRA